MSKPTAEQVMQAKDHLVSVSIESHDAIGTPFAETLVGILKEPMDLGGEFGVTFFVVTEYHPGTYDDFADRGNPLGASAGLGVSLDREVVDFTDHGARTDALLNIERLEAQRNQALNALKAAEKDIAQAYLDVTNLTSQEG